MILVIDNYDSFVHTLARYLREAGAQTHVVRNDAVDVVGVARLAPAAIVLSPGPGRPEDAGASLQIVRAYVSRMPMLGVCLGHQCLIAAEGGRVTRARRPLHGQASAIRHDEGGLFEGLPNPFEMGRYHSLIVELDPRGHYEACAWSEEGEIMAVRRRGAPVFGLQFHPESILSPYGRRLIERFVQYANGRRAA